MKKEGTVRDTRLTFIGCSPWHWSNAIVFVMQAVAIILYRSSGLFQKLFKRWIIQIVKSGNWKLISDSYINQHNLKDLLVLMLHGQNSLVAGLIYKPHWQNSSSFCFIERHRIGALLFNKIRKTRTFKKWKWDVQCRIVTLPLMRMPDKF